MKKLVNRIESLITVLGTIAIAIIYCVVYFTDSGIKEANLLLAIFAIYQIGVSFTSHRGLLRILAVVKIGKGYGYDLNGNLVKYSPYWVEKNTADSVITIGIYTIILFLINSPVFTTIESIGIVLIGFIFRSYYRSYCFDKYSNDNKTVLVKTRAN